MIEIKLNLRLFSKDQLQEMMNFDVFWVIIVKLLKILESVAKLVDSGNVLKWEFL